MSSVSISSFLTGSLVKTIRDYKAEIYIDPLPSPNMPAGNAQAFLKGTGRFTFIPKGTAGMICKPAVCVHSVRPDIPYQEGRKVPGYSETKQMVLIDGIAYGILPNILEPVLKTLARIQYNMNASTVMSEFDLFFLDEKQFQTNMQKDITDRIKKESGNITNIYISQAKWSFNNRWELRKVYKWIPRIK